MSAREQMEKVKAMQVTAEKPVAVKILTKGNQATPPKMGGTKMETPLSRAAKAGELKADGKVKPVATKKREVKPAKPIAEMSVAEMEDAWISEKKGGLIAKVQAALRTRKYTDEEITKETGAKAGTVMQQRYRLRKMGDYVPKYIKDENGKTVESAWGTGKNKAKKNDVSKKTLSGVLNSLPSSNKKPATKK